MLPHYYQSSKLKSIIQDNVNSDIEDLRLSLKSMKLNLSVKKLELLKLRQELNVQ